MVNTSSGSKILQKLIQNYERRQRASSVNGNIMDTCYFKNDLLDNTKIPEEISSISRARKSSFKNISDSKETTATRLPIIKTIDSTKKFNIEETVIYKPVIMEKPLYQKQVKKNKGGFCLFKCFA
jgi:hypothetical protein